MSSLSVDSQGVARIQWPTSLKTEGQHQCKQIPMTVPSVEIQFGVVDRGEPGGAIDVVILRGHLGLGETL
jgi:hypothetical protein